MSTPRLKEIRFSPNAEQIKVANKPISKNGDAKIVEIPTKIFAKSVGMKGWIENSLMVNEDFKVSTDKSLPLMEIDKEFFNILKESAASFRDRLVICKINEEVGFGVFAQEGIAFNACLGFYMGHFTHIMTTNHIDSLYSMAIAPSNSKEIGVDIEAKDYGNITRFFQHLPEEKATAEKTLDLPISEYKFTSPASADNVATANVHAKGFQYKGYPILAFMTTRKISAFEQIGLNYGEKYWINNNKMFSLFDKAASIISPTLYSFNPLVEFIFGNNKATTRAMSLSEWKNVSATGILLELKKNKVFFSSSTILKALIKHEKTPQFLRLCDGIVIEEEADNSSESSATVSTSTVNPSSVESNNESEKASQRMLKK